MNNHTDPERRRKTEELLTDLETGSRVEAREDNEQDDERDDDRNGRNQHATAPTTFTRGRVGGTAPADDAKLTATPTSLSLG